MLSRRLAIFVVTAALLIAAAASRAHDVDPRHLPLGDGKISTAPRVGWIWACRIDPDGGGAQRNGPWIHGDTWDSTAKMVVGGAVKWLGRWSIELQGDRRVFTSNGLPNHPTGAFPIAPSEPVYQYDRNPNRIAEHAVRVELPASPTLAAQPSCAPGAVGIMLNGVPLFSALDAPGRDAPAHEAQDACQGHPQVTGVYHYHNLTHCIDDKRAPDGHSDLVGYALDGFGIFGPHGEGGAPLASDDLDECHGHTHPIMWDGKLVTLYHYHATPDFPYSVGCMRGTVRLEDVRVVSGPPPVAAAGRAPPGGTPPGGTPPGGAPNLAAAARALQISEARLRAALGPPPPDFSAAARRLGISEDRLRQALGAP
jgi:hypothetical protein